VNIAPVVLLVILSCGGLLWLIWPKGQPKLSLEMVMKILSENAQAMALRKSQLIYSDHYGTPKTDKWEKEKLYIANNLINPKLQEAGFAAFPMRLLLPLIEHSVGATETKPVRSDLSKVSTGAEYEVHCAKILRSAGWAAQLTVATGDQGTDIIAERDGRRVVIQCKFYTRPVGNKAVQEAAAARMHEKADEAVVVSNAAYTPAARQLAGTTGVRLLHHDDLSTF